MQKIIINIAYKFLTNSFLNLFFFLFKVIEIKTHTLFDQNDLIHVLHNAFTKFRRNVNKFYCNARDILTSSLKTKLISY